MPQGVRLTFFREILKNFSFSLTQTGGPFQPPEGFSRLLSRFFLQTAPTSTKTVHYINCERTKKILLIKREVFTVRLTFHHFSSIV